MSNHLTVRRVFSFPFEYKENAVRSYFIIDVKHGVLYYLDMKGTVEQTANGSDDNRVSRGFDQHRGNASGKPTGSGSMVGALQKSQEDTQMTKASAIKQETAEVAYERLHTEVDLMITVLKDAVKAHAKSQKKSPNQWDWVGDLVQTKKELQDIIQFIGSAK